MKDAPITECPERVCSEPIWGRGEVKRLLGTGAGLIFKGTGFYITDYRSESYKKAAKSESGEASSGKSASTNSGGEGAKSGGAVSAANSGSASTRDSTKPS